MHDDDENPKAPNDNVDSSGVSRRDFLKISGISVAAVPLVGGPKIVMAAGQEVPVYGPGKVPMEFVINGKNHKATLERGELRREPGSHCNEKVFSILPHVHLLIHSEFL